MVVVFKEPKFIGGEHRTHLNADNATLIPVNGFQCVQFIIPGLLWQPVMLLTDILRFDVN